jgi:hypothetical protein
MPYQKEALSAAETALLRRWIREGANWDLHWAFKPVEAPAIPKTEAAWYEFWRKTPDEDWPRRDLDRFVLHRLHGENLSPAPEAEQAHTWPARQYGSHRAATLPGLETVYLNDTTAGAYERLVDTLLAAPQYGERWAAPWLDLARYADTKGYERDARRQVWRYRDQVIRALNQDMPYDQFLTEQLAGDLLPEPN